MKKAAKKEKALIEPEESSPAEHLDYLVSSIRLKLWFTWQSLDEHPGETFVKTLQDRVDLWRRTSLNPNYLDGALGSFDSPEWRELVKALEDIYVRNRKNGSAAAFEEEGIAFLMPYLTPRVDRDLCDLRNKVDLAKYQCGSLRYDLQPDQDHPQRISFHIANACYPLSPFADPGYFPRCFMDLMAQCEKKFNVTEIGTGTWMNSNNRWLKLFPQEWMEHLSPPNFNVYWHYGFWGQFLTARKTFNHKLGQQFRDTGRIPFPIRSSWCTIAAMRKHLQGIL